MNIISRSLLSGISIIVLSLLIFFTFLSENENTGLTEFQQIENSIGYFQLERNNSHFSLSQVDDLHSATGSVILEQLNNFDQILSIGTPYTFNEDTNNFELEDGVYVFHFTDLVKNYTISAPSFALKSIGAGSFIINTLDPKKVSIFSIDKKLDISLLDPSSGNTLQTLEVYPHHYFIFNPNRNIYLKNADLLKIKQITTLGYFEDSIFTQEHTLDSELADIISFRNDSINQVLSDIFFFLSKKYTNTTELFLSYTDNTPFFLPGEEYIAQYHELFLNEEKRKTYYKNLILKRINLLYNSEQINSEDQTSLIELMSVFKDINFDGYEEMLDVFNFYYRNILATEINKNRQINFHKVYQKLHNQKLSSPDLVFLDLKNSFFQYNFGINKNFYNDISLFIEKYLHDNSLQENQNISELEYVLFFLENILLSNLYDNTEEDIDIENLITIFNNYVNIANYYYSKNNNDKNILSGLYVHSKILSKFLVLAESYYFKPDRNDNNLLELSRKHTIDPDILELFQKNINILLSFYKEHKILLENSTKTQDKHRIVFYESSSNKFDEYFLALRDYKQYKSQNDIALTLDSISEKIDVENTLSIEKAKNFLLQFDGLMNENYDIKIKGYSYCLNPTAPSTNINSDLKEVPECYEIKNFNVNGVILSFLLFPYEGNTISNIVLTKSGKTQEKKGSYILDELKESYEKQFHNTTDKDKKDLYDFSKFFLNNFVYTNRGNSSEEFVSTENNTLPEEDDLIKFFKRNKLLGEGGEFSILDDIFYTSYNNVLVTREGNNYSTHIKKASLDINRKEGSKNIEYKFDFSSFYDFQNHAFFLIKLTYKDKKGKTLFYGNPIILENEYPILNFKKDIDVLLGKINEITKVVNTLGLELGISNIQIRYIKNTKEIHFSGKYENKDLSILLKDGKIINFSYNGNNLVKTPTSYMNIGNIIKKLLTIT